ncbi:HAMP domain-containing sensor histidine kinase [Massilia sp. DJPM01]|uniref:sensor histidine kinase n=1 Tax=Massilia sp. DJPM01 TaxID=3024404 RepID=UPI00259ED59E|nr:HAMP domain-containing sensor histidine kinase [Massilia sp. DJPM01]MDM5180047.1 HAMP domain-containing sensor histidine kinase [Massilia sp. DJPM01]
MKLSRFILSHLDDILKEWEDFARSLSKPGVIVPEAELQDHARQMLKAIALDMETIESAQQKKEKSVGDVSKISGGESAASTHGSLRQLSGFTMPEVTAEFRAMRASVLRLWMDKSTRASKANTAEILRFNESIDQALQESAVRFSDERNRTRDTFLAILGHDLRSPLATMTMAGAFLVRPTIDQANAMQIGARISRSAAAMTTMVNDLLEYARTQLGGAIPIRPVLGDIVDICQSAVDEASAAHPECIFEVEKAGERIGDYDAPRLAQVFSNLLNNAAQYKGENHPVTISTFGEAEATIVQVKNFGPEIPRAFLAAIFDPLVQLAIMTDQKGPATTSMGLGLFIAREIVTSHGGTIEVESSVEAGTIFTVRLPRAAPLPTMT